MHKWNTGYEAADGRKHSHLHAGLQFVNPCSAMEPEGRLQAQLVQVGTVDAFRSLNTGL